MRISDDEVLLSASDMSVHLGCSVQTQLNRRAALGLLESPPPDPMLAVLQERGLRHEQEYVAYLTSAGAAAHVDLRGQAPDAQGVEATRSAMEQGADIITQAPLVHGRFRGIADVLLRIDTPSPGLGKWSYRAVDTKLSTETRAGTILQLCLYTRIVGEIQGLLPDEFWVVSPGEFESPERFRTTDFLAFARRVERELEDSVDGDLPDEALAPEPVPQCDICRWWHRCEERRRKADHLAYVAGISRLQRRELEQASVSTLTALADVTLPIAPEPRRGSADSYERVHHQARVQLASVGKTPVVEYLGEGVPADDSGPASGLGRLPEPSSGDVFLDLEGDPFVEGGGLEYLFGWVTIGGDSAPNYTRRWALDTAAEKAAFEEVIDALIARWDRHPNFAVYHFGAYEPAALKRLMGRHATREEELDRLLRGERFVDLHTVVRESLRIGVETYGLKQLEAVHGYTRELDLREASLAKHRLERALELGVPDEAPDGSAQDVEQYNRDDCVSTWRLRDWLEEKRSERTAEGVPISRPSLGQGIPSEDQVQRSAEIQALMDTLLDGVPDERDEREPEEQARWLLAFLLEWHRREAKAGWWEFFRLADLPPPDLLEERQGIAGLEFVERLEQGRKLPIDQYRYVEQDHDLRLGKSLFVSKDEAWGTVESVDLGSRMIGVKKRRDSLDTHPDAAFVKDIVSPHPIPGALERVAKWVASNGIDTDGKFRASRDLLLANDPRLSVSPGSALARAGEEPLACAVRLGLDLQESVLPIQGPPGTGKTFTGARVICALVASGQKVGITGPSHRVIRNLLDAVVEAAAERGESIRILQKVKDKSPQPNPGIKETTKPTDLPTALAQNECDVAAGTVWQWAREDSDGLVDTLVVDEAGQLSLANAVAAATAARNVILLGDPQQLEQPIQGSHPPGCDVSVLQQLLGAHDTVPPDRGLFLDATWRLHPNLCDFTSELFYEGRLNHHPQCASQRVTGPTRFAEHGGAGLWLSLIDHEGNTSSSAEEVDRIRELVADLISPGVQWIDFAGAQRDLAVSDLRIVSPYNAQVSALRSALPEVGEWIGTVDRFQGQQAPVVIYSMTTSSVDEAPRGLEFLFSLNRLNVATSRARCVCILVASPALLGADCGTPRQMKLVNALCRYQELANLDMGGE